MIRALTLAQPWPVAFDLGKDIENREWAPWTSVLGHYIALHGGARKSAEVARYDSEFILAAAGERGLGHRLPLPQIFGVFAVIRITGCVRNGQRSLDENDPTTSPWWMGPIGWTFEDYNRLEQPIPCPGALGLWNLPGDIEDQLLEQLPWLGEL